MAVITAQEGFQKQFLSSKADIVIGGSAAGVGKTFALLLDPVRHIKRKGFTAVIFRRTTEQIRQSGGLWDTTYELYPLIKGKSKEQAREWIFPSGAKISFDHLQYEKDKISWQGSEIAYLGFDELTHFTKSQFFYLITRQRTTCGIRPHARATCNPDPDSWVAGFVKWWIGDDGFPIAERVGKLRYFTMDGGGYVWGDSAEEVAEKIPHIIKGELKDFKLSDLIKSVTFIPGSIHDNKVLMEKDPSYLGNLLAQDDETKARLLEGNWKHRSDEDEIIKYTPLRDSFSNNHIGRGEDGKILPETKYISADIALHGSDRFVVFVWSGWRVIDCYISNKLDPREVVDKIEELATIHAVHRSNIAYDADGLGTYLRGYLAGARPIVNGSKPFSNEQYQNLKAQMAYTFARFVNQGDVYVTPLVAMTEVVDGKKSKTVEELILDERRALKRLKPDSDGKLKIIGKEQAKNILGRSPDVIEALMYRAYFEVRKNSKTIDYE